MKKEERRGGKSRGRSGKSKEVGSRGEVEGKNEERRKKWEVEGKSRGR